MKFLRHQDLVNDRDFQAVNPDILVAPEGPPDLLVPKDLLDHKAQAVLKGQAVLKVQVVHKVRVHQVDLEDQVAVTFLVRDREDTQVEDQVDQQAQVVLEDHRGHLALLGHKAQADHKDQVDLKVQAVAIQLADQVLKAPVDLFQEVEQIIQVVAMPLQADHRAQLFQLLEALEVDQQALVFQVHQVRFLLELLIPCNALFY